MSSNCLAYAANHCHPFHQRIERALEVVKRILDETKNPTYAAEVDHEYNDKFRLVEYLTNVAVAAEINVLERLGIDHETMLKLIEASEQGKRSLTLRFDRVESCEFIEERVVRVDGPQEHVAEMEGVKSSGATVLKKMHGTVATKVKEYHWKFTVNYEIFAFAGSDPKGSNTSINAGSMEGVLVTTGDKKQAPQLENRLLTYEDVSLTWLMRNAVMESSSMECDFSIDRCVDTCYTPVQNDDVAKAIEFFDSLMTWHRNAAFYFTQTLGAIESHYSSTTNEAISTDIHSVNTDGVFMPVLPIFNDIEPRQINNSGQEVATAKASDSILPRKDVNLFLAEQCRSLDEKSDSLNGIFNDSCKLFKLREAKTVLLLHHAADIADYYKNGISYVENMIRSQLVAAIDKEVQASDFSEYMAFYNKKLFKPNYVPRPFCYTVRRPEHYPDGTLSIVEGIPGESKPIYTITSEREEGSMSFQINAATSVTFKGKRHIHGWVRYDFRQFGCRRTLNLQPTLIARARQFSSFLLLIGNISGPTSFDPKHAIILQNKDEVILPLLLEQLPTPKEFKDAIKSLSPEQQNFATAFRSMQLESSVFGICLIQLKPQLEVLLRLPPDSLTKEVGLMQDLLDLFVKYQIPSDLLTYDGNDSALPSEKVSAVKRHVGAINDVISSSKKKQLDDAAQEADMLFEKKNVAHETEEVPMRFSLLGGPPSRGSDRNIAAKSRVMRYGVPAAFASVPFQEAASISHDAPLPPPATFNAANSFNRPSAPRPTQQLRVAQDGTDFTMVPKQLDERFERSDKDSAVRPTVIKVGNEWTKIFQPNLLMKAEQTILDDAAQRTEKDKAFDLLDALSRSGSLSLQCAELHVLVAVTHCFDQSVMDTVVTKNINPVEKIERSILIAASVIHNKTARSLTLEDSPAYSLKHIEESTSSERRRTDLGNIATAAL